MELQEFSVKYAQASAAVGRLVLGQDQVVQQVLLAMIVGGHVLLEGAPGLGKTLLVRSLGSVLGCSFGRIQFTPDLMPSDVTGSNVYNSKSAEFEFVKGPLFNQLVLADEINRAPAKTQSALLEAMQERAVTIDGVSRQLGPPFLVLATQNPIESQGTYPLPEAQLDRFLFKLNVDYPTKESEESILNAYLGGFNPQNLLAPQVLSVEELLAMRTALEAVNVSPEIVRYITELVRATRSDRNIEVGASPRASIGLLTASRAVAAADGRDFVLPDDVKSLAPSVLQHRIILHPDAELEGMKPAEVIDSLLREVQAPGGLAS